MMHTLLKANRPVVRIYTAQAAIKLIVINGRSTQAMQAEASWEACSGKRMAMQAKPWSIMLDLAAHRPQTCFKCYF